MISRGAVPLFESCTVSFDYSIPILHKIAKIKWDWDGFYCLHTVHLLHKQTAAWFGTDLWSLSQLMEWTSESLYLSCSNFGYLLTWSVSVLGEERFHLRSEVFPVGENNQKYWKYLFCLAVLMCFFFIWIRIYLLWHHAQWLQQLNALRLKKTHTGKQNTSKLNKLLHHFDNTSSTAWKRTLRIKIHT